MKIPVLFVFALVALAPIGHAHAIDSVPIEEPGTDPEPWIAEYEGEVIDLRFGWDTAKACLTDGVETQCWDTEAEMVAATGLPETGTTQQGSSGLLRASCSSFLRLYTGANYTGSVLALSTRGIVLNLSSYGFNNVTTSYRVGGCDSAFWDLSNAGGPLYGGATSAWAQSGSMNAGWDNKISSVLIA